MNKTPLYKYPADYARENGELEQYRESRRANVACKKAIETAVEKKWNGWNLPDNCASEVFREFGAERVSYVLANTLRYKENDERFSHKNRDWAKTVPMYDSPDRRENCIVESHPAKLDFFVDAARHEILLRTPLTKEEIQSEAEHLLSMLQSEKEPNSPNGTHYIAPLSGDFLTRAGTKDTDRLMRMLPFQSLALCSLNGLNGIYAVISKNEDRNQKLVLRKPSIRRQLAQEVNRMAASAPAKKAKGHEER